MMHVIAISRREAQEYTANEPYVVVSITDPGSQDVVFQKDDNRKAVLSLQFHDVDRIMPGVLAINAEQGEQIWAFAKENAQRVELIVCHCEAGISRSAGVAAALSKAFNDDDKKFFESNRYLPNRRAYRAVLKASQE